MNELIENTVQIISKLGHSSKGYILQLDEYGYKVLKMWGGKNEEFELLNDVLFNLFKTDGIQIDKVAALPQVKQLLKKIILFTLFRLETIKGCPPAAFYTIKPKINHEKAYLTDIFII